MWIPCVVFAHAFAGYFLLGMAIVMYPRAWAGIKRRLLCRGASKDQHVQSPRASAGAKPDVVASTATDTEGAADQDKVHAASPPKDAAAGPDESPFRSTTQYYDPADDEEMGIPADASSQGNNGATVPSQRSRLLMRRLTTMLKPMVMEWQDIGCSYNTSAGMKTVLKNVWGRADPGDMLALMGPSGAGKSTLMDILAGRKSVGNLTGAVLVNGRPRKQAEFARKTAYVPQDDNFMPTMTVIETCHYYATLTLPRHWSKATVKERIKEVLAAMGLSHTLNTLVGGTLPGGIILRGLSGGERKRLSIATGIMSTPCIVFLDEPTSGLDSFAALSVMSYMKSMAAGGQTVVSSIHQPRAAIWALFDSVTLLSMGHLMYFGPREDLVSWFTDGCGYPYDPKMHGLASDWVMDLVNIGFKKPEVLFGRMMNTMEELDTAATAFRKRYLSSAHGHSVIPGVTPFGNDGQAAAAPRSANPAAAGAGGDEFDKLDAAYGQGGNTNSHAVGNAQLDSMNRAIESIEEKAVSRGLCGLGAPKSSKGAASWFTQFRVLLWREFLSITRNPADVAGRCLIFCWLAIFVGLIYYNLPNTVDSLRSRLNVLFVEPVILLLLPYVYMSLYTADKQYYIADSSAKLYHPSAYYVAKQMAVMPFAILNVLLFSFTLYGLAGLRHQGSAVGMNGLMSVLMYLIAAQVLSFAAVVTPNQDLAFMLAIAWTAINLLLSNFMVRYVDMSQNWFSQLRYISAMGFGFEGYARAEFLGVTYSCAGGLAPTIIAYIPTFLPNTAQINSPIVRNALTNPGKDCTVRLDSILDYFELFRPFWMVVVILLGYLGFFHIVTYIGFLYLTKKEKR
jgi:ABC-type multidrug transport system ATPase subunit